MNIATFRFQTFHPSFYSENLPYIPLRGKCETASSVFLKGPTERETPFLKRGRHIRCTKECICSGAAYHPLHNADSIEPPEYSKSADAIR